jgi:hypothetical protein
MIYEGFRKKIDSKDGDNALNSWHRLTLVLWKLQLINGDERLTVALMLMGRLARRDGYIK